MVSEQITTYKKACKKAYRKFRNFPFFMCLNLKRLVIYMYSIIIRGTWSSQGIKIKSQQRSRLYNSLAYTYAPICVRMLFHLLCTNIPPILYFRNLFPSISSIIVVDFFRCCREKKLPPGDNKAKQGFCQCSEIHLCIEQSYKTRVPRLDVGRSYRILCIFVVCYLVSLHLMMWSSSSQKKKRVNFCFWVKIFDILETIKC